MKERWTAVLEDLRRRVGVGGEDGIRVGWALSTLSKAGLGKPRASCWSVEVVRRWTRKVSDGFFDVTGNNNA